MSPPNSHPSFSASELSVAKEFAAGDARSLVEIPLAFGKRVAHILLYFVLQRIGAKNKRASKIGFPLFKYRPEIEE